MKKATTLLVDWSLVSTYTLNESYIFPFFDKRIKSYSFATFYNICRILLQLLK